MPPAAWSRSACRGSTATPRPWVPASSRCAPYWPTPRLSPSARAAPAPPYPPRTAALPRRRPPVPVPDGLALDVAAATLLQGITAHYLANDSYPVRPGDWAIVHAAAGGVGLLLTQLVKQRGGRVLATTSSPEKAQLAREAGADEVVDYADFAARAKEVSGGEGVAVVYDGIGRTTFADGLTALRPTGSMIVYG